MDSPRKCGKDGISENCSIGFTNGVDDEHKLIIYVLKLKNGAYYIGSTTNFIDELDAHKRGELSDWTILYPAVDLESIFQIDTRNYPKKLTKVKELFLKYVCNHGIDKVRCDIYPLIVLLDAELIKIKYQASAFKMGMSTTSNRGKYVAQKPKCENAGKPWESQDDKRLCRLFDGEIKIKDIATDMQRTPGAIRSRLKRLGKIDMDGKHLIGK